MENILDGGRKAVKRVNATVSHKTARLQIHKLKKAQNSTLTLNGIFQLFRTTPSMFYVLNL